jgi:Primase X
MLRIPSSHNSKCVKRNDGIADYTTEVKGVQDWSTHSKQRARIYLLLGSFLAYPVDRKLELGVKKQRYNKYASSGHLFNNYDNNKKSSSSIYYSGLEKLLQTPIADHRKYCIWRILSPYLLNVKKLSNEEAYSIMNDWLDKCNKLERLNFNAKAKIKEGLKDASKGYHPVSLEKLKQEDKVLYDILKSNL